MLRRQVTDPNDFVQLEPWAVPCGTDWMKEHESRWQGAVLHFREVYCQVGCRGAGVGLCPCAGDRADG